MGEKRILVWDNVKFFLMFMVVIGHLADGNTAGSRLFRSVFLIVYSFHMPLFLFVSGLFHKNTKIKEKMVSYFSLYIVLKIVFFFVRILNGGKPSFQVFTEDGLPWFMFSMACYVGVTYFLRDIDKRYVLVISLLLGLFAGYDKEVGKYLVASRTIVYYPFFVLGTMIQREQLERLMKNPKCKILGWLVMTGFSGLCLLYTDRLYIFRHLFTGQNFYKEEIFAFGAVYRIAAYAIAVTVGLAFLLMIPTGNLKKISEFGKRTLQIYFWHHVIVLLLRGHDVYTRYFSETLGMQAVWLLLGVPIILLVSLKPFQYPVHWLLYPVRSREKEEK